MKIAFFDTKPYDKVTFTPIAEKLGVEINYFDEKLTKDTAHLAKGYDASCSFVNDNVSAEAVQTLKDVGIKAILLRCAGFDSIDLEKAKELELPVLRVPAYSPASVAEFAVTLLMAVNRKVHVGYNRTTEFNFSIDGLLGTDLRGKTAGVIGTGKIGKVLIEILTGFGMNIIAYDLFPDKSSRIKYVDLDTLLKESDVISLHAPLTKDNKHMINKDSIAKMKDDVFLINSARGGLINTLDLIDALEQGKFAGVGLDVCEHENDYFFEDMSDKEEKDETLAKLLSFDNLILTGHQAFFTKEATDAIAEITLNNFINFMKDGDLTNEVNRFLESIK